MIQREQQQNIFVCYILRRVARKYYIFILFFAWSFVFNLKIIKRKNLNLNFLKFYLTLKNNNNKKIK